jgi:hypothetical protein
MFLSAYVKDTPGLPISKLYSMRVCGSCHRRVLALGLDQFVGPWTLGQIRVLLEASWEHGR